VSSERCTACDTPRTGAFRYCLKCGFDFEPRPAEHARPAPAARQETRSPALGVATPPVLRDVQPAGIGAGPALRGAGPAAIGPRPSPAAIEPPLVAVGPSTAVPAPVPVPCPYLGLVDDPDTTFMFAAPGHRCRADSTPVKISLPHQGTYCLSGEYQTCPRFPKAHTKRLEQVGTTRPNRVSQPGVRRGLGGRSFVRLVMLVILLTAAAIWVLGTSGASVGRPLGSIPAGTPGPGASASARPN
jgi:hypothetical protein